MHLIMLWSLDTRNLLDRNYQNNVKAFIEQVSYPISYFHKKQFLDLE